MGRILSFMPFFMEGKRHREVQISTSQARPRASLLVGLCCLRAYLRVEVSQDPILLGVSLAKGIPRHCSEAPGQGMFPEGKVPGTQF